MFQSLLFWKSSWKIWTASFLGKMEHVSILVVLEVVLEVPRQMQIPTMKEVSILVVLEVVLEE